MKRRKRIMENLIYAAYGGSQSGITIRDLQLGQKTAIPTPFEITDLTNGGNHDLFATSNNTIYHLSTDGKVLNSFTWSSDTIKYTSISVRGNCVVVAYEGSQSGVTIRDLSLVQMEHISIDGKVNGVYAGENNDLFLTVGNEIRNYDLGGGLINKFAWTNGRIVYEGISSRNGLLHIAYTGVEKGVTIRDMGLRQQHVYITGIDADSITAGEDMDSYLSLNNSLYHFDSQGTILEEMTWPETSVKYSGLCAIYEMVNA